MANKLQDWMITQDTRMIKLENKLKDILKTAKNWADIHAALKLQNTAKTEEVAKNTEAGFIFEAFTKMYLIAHPGFDYEYVWYHDELPKDVREKLNFYEVDHGADVVAQTKDGKLVAIQCKFVNDQSKTLTWGGTKLSHLIAYGKKADIRMVFTNASDVDKATKNSDPVGVFQLVGYDSIYEVTENVLEAMYDLLSKRQPRARKLWSPRLHQQHAIDATLDILVNKDKSRAQINLPCGAGKSLYSLWVKEALQPKKTLVLVPSLALVRQIKGDYLEQHRQKFIYQVVCSETNITKSEEDELYQDKYQIDASAVSDTEIDSIREFMMKKEDSIVFSTYQSLEAIIKAMDGTDLEFDLILCDEAHKTAGTETGMMTLVHNNDLVPAKKRIYMTATPKYVSTRSKNLNEKNGNPTYCMRDEEMFGEVAFSLNFHDGIKGYQGEDPFLTDYKLVLVNANDTKLADALLGRERVSKEDNIEERMTNIAINKAMEDLGIKHPIVYSSTVKKAEALSERHQVMYPDVFSTAVNGQMSTYQRNVEMDRFKNAEQGIISNARCLTEGVDIKAVDAVIFCDPRNSKVDIVQAVGRAIRLYEGKKYGYIILPVYMEEGDNLEDFMESNAYGNMYTIINALRQHDSRMSMEISKLITKDGKRIKARATDAKDNEDVSQVKSLGGFLNFVGFSNVELAEKLTLQVVSDVVGDRDWLTSFELLKDYVEANGIFPTISKDKKLFSFVSRSRQEYKNNKLSKERIQKLDEINFDWHPEITNWNNNYKKVQEFFNEKGCLPTESESYSMSKWIYNQRKYYKKDKLEDTKIKLLEDLNIDWNPNKDKFYEIYEELDNYINVHGEFPKGGKSTLGNWVARQRQLYNQGKLADHKINALEDLNIVWDSKIHAWYTKYNQVIQYLKDNGNFPGETNDKILGGWCSEQRKAYKKGKLSKDQITLLEKHGFAWDAQQAKWWDNFNTLVEFIKSTGKLPSWKNKSLYKFMNRQKQSYKEGKLLDYQVTELKGLNII